MIIDYGEKVRVCVEKYDELATETWTDTEEQEELIREEDNKVTVQHNEFLTGECGTAVLKNDLFHRR